MLTLNLIRKCYIPFVLKALQKSKSMQVTVQKKKYPNLGSTQTKIALPHKFKDQGLHLKQKEICIPDQYLQRDIYL